MVPMEMLLQILLRNHIVELKKKNKNIKKENNVDIPFYF